MRTTAHATGRGRGAAARLVPVVAARVQAGRAKVRAEPGVCAHPAAEAQPARGGHRRHGRAVQAKLHVGAVLGLELLRRRRHLPGACRAARPYSTALTAYHRRCK